MHASFVIGFLVENLDGVWDVRCYGTCVSMLGALCCLEILMAWDSHYGMVLFQTDNALEGGRVFDLSKDCGYCCGAMALFVLSNGSILFLFE